MSQFADIAGSKKVTHSPHISIASAKNWKFVLHQIWTKFFVHSTTICAGWRTSSANRLKSTCLSCSPTGLQNQFNTSKARLHTRQAKFAPVEIVSAFLLFRSPSSSSMDEKKRRKIVMHCGGVRCCTTAGKVSPWKRQPCAEKPPRWSRKSVVARCSSMEMGVKNTRTHTNSENLNIYSRSFGFLSP